MSLLNLLKISLLQIKKNSFPRLLVYYRIPMTSEGNVSDWELVSEGNLKKNALENIMDVAKK